jgi:hypothetical protein
MTPHDITWNDLPVEKRIEICLKAGMWDGCAKRPWDQWMAHDKARLAIALEEISGGTATLKDTVLFGGFGSGSV